MADGVRSYGSREPLAREEFDSNAGDASGDPLAELARLIGQSDPQGDHRRNPRGDDGRPGEDLPALDWAAGESYAEPANDAQDRHRPALAAALYPPLAPEDQEGRDGPRPGPRFFSGPSAAFNGFHHDGGREARADEQPYADEPPPASPGRRMPAFASAPPDQHGGAEFEPHDGDHDDAADRYHDEPEAPRRRSGLVIIMAVAGLVVLGTAGAFGYRAMFGGSMLPSLPPIIKASNGPNKIMPTYGDATTSNASQNGAANASATEKLASAPEQPIDIPQPLKTAAPRVVSTIPIVSDASASPPGAVTPGSPVLPGPAAASPTASASAMPVAPMAAPIAPAAASPAWAPVAAEPKKIHTVTIRGDRQGAHETALPTATRRLAAVGSVPTPARGNAPLSIVPGAGGEPAAPTQARMRAPAAPMAVASAAPESQARASSASGGGYAVQVSSQRSEADAKSAFRALRNKFPKELSGREPIVRRADLGAKGVFYRALVGPFASMEQAAGMCSSLKAAGGNCLVQRN